MPRSSAPSASSSTRAVPKPRQPWRWPDTCAAAAAVLGAVLLGLWGCAQVKTSQEEAPAANAHVQLLAPASLREPLGVMQKVLAPAGLGEWRVAYQTTAQEQAARKADMHIHAEVPFVSRPSDPVPAGLLARDALCLLAAPGLNVAPATVLGILLRPQVQWAAISDTQSLEGQAVQRFYQLADGLQPGVGATLQAKVRPLPAKKGALDHPAAQTLAQGRVQAALTLCSDAQQAQHDVTGSQVVALPPALAVQVHYRLQVNPDAPAASQKLAQALQTEQARQTWRAQGLLSP